MTSKIDIPVKKTTIYADASGTWVIVSPPSGAKDILTVKAPTQGYWIMWRIRNSDGKIAFLRINTAGTSLTIVDTTETNIPLEITYTT